MDKKSSIGNPNPNSLNPLLATHFLRSLAHINRSGAESCTIRRSHRIRRVAYASMAFAARGNRAWSRALLRRLRSRAGMRSQSRRTARPVVTRRKVRAMRPRLLEPNRAGDLRRLVPGGAGMDYCSLLEEAADYIRCLSTQVQLMQSVVDLTAC